MMFGYMKSKDPIENNTISFKYAIDSNSKLNIIGNDECSICFVKFDIGIKCRCLPCFHAFHTKCIDKWLTLSKRCPICRNLLYGNDSTVDVNQPSSSNYHNRIVEYITGASKEVIERNTIQFQYRGFRPRDRNDFEDCLICSNNFREGEICRRLPCFHEFHRRCIDRLLHNRKCCSVCYTVIDEDPDLTRNMIMRSNFMTNISNYSNGYDDTPSFSDRLRMLFARIKAAFCCCLRGRFY